MKSCNIHGARRQSVVGSKDRTGGMYATSSREAVRVREVNITVMQRNRGTCGTLDRVGLSGTLLTHVE